MNRPKRVAAIHDISGFGRCSLTVIIPVLSAMGIQVCPVPTEVLSTHTGGMGDVVMRDLTDFISPALAHYKKLDIGFECVYSGFLASFEQIDYCIDFFKAYPGALAVVDPVMGDHGRPYRTVTSDMQKRMNELVAVAGLITPNLTEAEILLGEPYDNLPMTHTRAKSLLTRLSKIGPAQVVITGVHLASTEKISNIGYDRDKNTFWCVSREYIPASYPGTGDLFASILTGSLLNDDSLPMAMSRASEFVELAIKTTYGYGEDTRYGVMFERLLPQIMNRDLIFDYHTL